MTRDYFVGLDIGTESIGWAVTDPEYHILKKNQKALWGVRSFEEAKKKDERRAFRTARRRLERRKQRIDWLQQIFSEEIARVDPAFFQRLEESKFLETDKKETQDGQKLGRYTLFADKDYNDRDYHRDYPTIYHLRNALMTEDRPFDVRLVYLAIHHILKNRGHFLFDGLKLEEVSFERCTQELADLLQDEYELQFSLRDPDAFQDALTDRTLGVLKKKAALYAASGLNKKSNRQLLAIIDLLAGAKASLCDLCDMQIENTELQKLSFEDENDTLMDQLSDLLGEHMQLVLCVKRVYDWSILSELLGGKPTLSAAKIAVYDQHHDDLQRLKAILRIKPEVYKEVFRISRKSCDNYPAYSGHGAANYRCSSYDNFRKFIKKQIAEIKPLLGKSACEEADRILIDLDAGRFLRKQTSKDNGVIPHQLHEHELQIILERAAKYLSFLNQRDESGITRSEQILSVFRFRIPYYVGPLNPRSEHSWLVRSEGKILPWTFEKVVDLEASAERFITRMTAKCSYIGESVIPKDSLLYSRFTVLNTLNKVKVNGHPIGVETKQKIFSDLFLSGRRISARALENYLLANGLMQKGDALTGIDEDFKTALTAHSAFARILSRGGAEDMVEDIIRHIVLLGEDRKLLERWLSRTYGQALSRQDQEYVLTLRKRFSGWGNLSRELLTEIKHADPQTGELRSIIDMLWETNDNLNELLSSRYTFAQGIEEWRENKFRKQTLEDLLDDSYASPGIRRAIRQTMALLSEIEKLMGAKPRRVFVEVAREHGEKKPTTSRETQLRQLYAACKKDEPDLFDLLQNFPNDRLRSAKYYLYFLQQGKCMYSEEPISLERLSTDYDIDHIYPQSLVKDDSLDNRVLVCRELNAAKGNRLLSVDIQQKMQPFWKKLLEKGFISKEKYKRLTRREPFGEEERAGFIARQLVETRQSCKIVANLLKARYGENDRVVYVKAGLVSDFRNDQRLLPDGTPRPAWTFRGQNIDTTSDPLFVKCRDINDLHHARDAYLNIVVGNVYHVKFTRSPLNFIRSGQTYSLNQVFTWDVVRGEEIAWRAGENGSIATVRHMMRKNNVLFTRYAHEMRGGLFDQMIRPKGEGQVSIKGSDPRMTVEHYGGYNKRTGVYFALIEHTEEKKRIRSIESVYLMDKAQYERDPQGYFENARGFKDVRILIPRIFIDSLVSIDGFRMHISGRSGDQIVYKNANQLILSPETAQYIKQISKYLDRCALERRDLPITSYDDISTEQNAQLYQQLLNKLTSTIYRIKYETAAKRIADHQDKFPALSPANQCRILMQILNLFNTTAASADLKLLCGKAGIGILKTSKNMSNLSGHRFTLIHQSVTGVFEQEIDLLGDTF